MPFHQNNIVNLRYSTKALFDAAFAAGRIYNGDLCFVEETNTWYKSDGTDVIPVSSKAPLIVKGVGDTTAVGPGNPESLVVADGDVIVHTAVAGTMSTGGQVLTVDNAILVRKSVAGSYLEIDPEDNPIVFDERESSWWYYDGASWQQISAESATTAEDWAATTAVEDKELRVLSLGGVNVLAKSTSARTTGASVDAAELGNWSYVSQSSIPAFQATTLLPGGFQVKHDGRLWQHNADATTGATFTEANWDAVTAAAKTLLRDWAAAESWEEGELAKRGGVVMRRNATDPGTPAEATFDATESARWDFVSQDSIDAWNGTYRYLAGEHARLDGGVILERISTGSPSTVNFYTDATEWTVVESPCGSSLDAFLAPFQLSSAGAGIAEPTVEKDPISGGRLWQFTDSHVSVVTSFEVSTSLSNQSFVASDSRRYVLEVEKQAVANHVIRVGVNSGAASSLHMIDIGTAAPGNVVNSQDVSFTSALAVNEKKSTFEIVLDLTWAVSAADASLFLEPVRNQAGDVSTQGNLTGTLKVYNYHEGPVPVASADTVAKPWGATEQVFEHELRLLTLGGIPVLMRSNSDRTTGASADLLEVGEWTYVSQESIPAFPASDPALPAGFQVRDDSKLWQKNADGAAAATLTVADWTELSYAPVVQLLSAAPAAPLAPGSYVLDSTGSPFSVELENVKGGWKFTNPNLSLDTNSVTITATGGDTFTDPAGVQSGTDFVLNQSGIIVEFYNPDGGTDYYTAVDRSLTAVSTFASGGEWNASTNTPDLSLAVNQVTTDGRLYVYNIAASGTQDIGSGATLYEAGGEIKWFAAGVFRYDPPTTIGHADDDVETVTGNGVNNTDARNPVINTAAAGTEGTIDYDVIADVTTDSDGAGKLLYRAAGGQMRQAEYDAMRVVVLSAAPVDGTTVAFFQGQLFWDRVNKNMYEALTASSDPDTDGTASTFQQISFGLDINALPLGLPTDYLADEFVFYDSNISANRKVALQEIVQSGYLGTAYYRNQDPAANNDRADNAGLGRKFFTGSIWVNSLTNKPFICVDDTNIAAVWQELSVGGLVPREWASGISVAEGELLFADINAIKCLFRSTATRTTGGSLDSTEFGFLELISQRNISASFPFGQTVPQGFRFSIFEGMWEKTNNDPSGGAFNAAEQIANWRQLSVKTSRSYNFDIAAWGAASGGEYTLTYTAAFHGLGTTPDVRMWRKDGTDYVSNAWEVRVNAAGDVSLVASETPDERFEGRIVIAPNRNF